ncbi:MAG: hypothetical protein L0Z52_10665 [Acidobacteria bacterium]|nr:hypothetical protein [Acidobacteriota bacterium]
MPETRRPGRNPRQGMTARALKNRSLKTAYRPRRRLAAPGKKHGKPA